MSGQQILVATLVATVIIAGGTVILVLYTPFGKDLWSLLGTALGRLARGVSQTWKALGRSFTSRMIFWLVLLLLTTAWALAVFARGTSFAMWFGGSGVYPLAVAAVASIWALQIAFYRGTTHVDPKMATVESPTISVHQAPDDAKAKRIEKIHLQLYAATAAIHKYADPDGHYTEWDQVKPINALIYKLLGEGEDLTAFLVPTEWEEGSGYVEDRRLVPRLEGLLIYLK